MEYLYIFSIDLKLNNDNKKLLIKSQIPIIKTIHFENENLL